MFVSHLNVPQGRISFQMQQEQKQARMQADFHPHLSLEKQYCCKRERRVRSINMRRNNLIIGPQLQIITSQGRNTNRYFRKE